MCIDLIYNWCTRFNQRKSNKIESKRSDIAAFTSYEQVGAVDKDLYVINHATKGGAETSSGKEKAEKSKNKRRTQVRLHSHSGSHPGFTCGWVTGALMVLDS